MESIGQWDQSLDRVHQVADVERLLETRNCAEVRGPVADV
jgi:hypothetical protein